MTTWITRFDPPADGLLRVAVKDAIDMAGVLTTAGCAPYATGRSWPRRTRCAWPGCGRRALTSSGRPR
ncbi:hypothetical protein ACIA5C_28545 [Actinoplanes sp. NPDC051343]|uniref:hypothetical protein n=1 Tax=Actinoplanes sp. NPDC051343 TaxID=3363906 RepID=UPI0037BE1639